jgi:methylaspartate mutase epsilon subunit
MDLKNEKLSQKEFEETRTKVLATWPTGKQVDIDEAVEYYRKMPKDKFLSVRLMKAKENKITLTQPRAGVATLEGLIRLLKFLEEEGHADLLPTTIDTYTRQNMFDAAERGLKESIESKRSLLNGFPAVNYGVEKCRKVVEAVKLPVQIRHGSPDARLLAEITLASGFTGFEGGSISYNLPYAKRVPLDKSIKDWQYVDSLIGVYQEHKVVINRESFGALTGTLVPPCICNVVSIIEAILAAEQGVKDFTVGYGQCGNLIQDIAALKSLEELGQEYLKRFGYKKIELTTCLHQWMGAFPLDEAQTFGVICSGAAAAALGRATKTITKSPDEAYGVPTMEANAKGIRATKQVLRIFKGQSLTNTEEVKQECDIIREETVSILEKVFELGGGDIAVGTVKAFEAGVIDVPFAPSVYNAGRVRVLKDSTGAVRFLDIGNLPFDETITRFHKVRIAKRTRRERKKALQILLDDIYSIGQSL